MTKHKLEELRNVKKHKENIIRNVKAAIEHEPKQQKRNWTYPLVMIAVTCALLFFIGLQVTKNYNPSETTANDARIDDFMKLTSYPASTEILYTTEQDDNFIVFYKDEKGFHIGYKLEQVDYWSFTGNGGMATNDGFELAMNNNPTIPHVMLGGIIPDASITQVVVKQRTVQQKATIINQGDYKLWFTQFEELESADPTVSGDPLKIEAYNADGTLVWRHGIYENGLESGRVSKTVVLDKQQLKELFQSQVRGSGFTHSEYFTQDDRIDQEGNVRYYQPIGGYDSMEEISSAMGNTIHPIQPEKLPFDANVLDVYAVTSKTVNGYQQNQLQFSYLQKSLDSEVNQFAIFTVLNVESNPLENVEFESETVDTVGNKIKNEGLIDEYPLFHQILTTDSALVYRYYEFDEKEKHVYMVATKANEFYTVYNGYVFHIGYQIDDMNQEEVQERMVDLVREFVLGNGLSPY